MSTEIYWVTLSFLKIGAVKAIIYLKVYMNFYPYSPHFCPILMKFSATKSAHNVVLKLRVSWKSAQGSPYFFGGGLNEITFNRVGWNPRTFWTVKTPSWSMCTASSNTPLAVLKFKNSTFCSHSVFFFFVRTSEKAAVNTTLTVWFS